MFEMVQYDYLPVYKRGERQTFEQQHIINSNEVMFGIQKLNKIKYVWII